MRGTFFVTALAVAVLAAPGHAAVRAEEDGGDAGVVLETGLNADGGSIDDDSDVFIYGSEADDTTAADAGVAPAIDAGAPDAGLPPPLAHLHGQVRTRGIRTPVPLATLVLSDGGVLAEADGQGRFSVELPGGTHHLTVRASGHHPLEVTETLKPGGDVEVLYRLERTEVPKYETVVRGQRDEGPARVELSRVESHEVAGTQGDPFRVTMLLPGVAAVASGLAYPVVRGTQPASTGFFLDGVRVPQLYHLLAGPAVVHPDFIDHVDFFPGVTPARYGRLLGGAVDGTVARPSDKLKATATVDLLNAGAFVSVPIERAHLNVTAAGRISYTGPIVTAVAKAAFPSTPDNPRPTPVVDFADYQGRVEWNAGPGRLRLLVLGAMDEAGVEQGQSWTPTTLLSSVFHRADLAWRQHLGVGRLEVGALAGTEQLGLIGESHGQRIGQFLMKRAGVSGRARWAGEVLDGLDLETGLEGERQLTSLEVSRTVTSVAGPAQSFREPESDGTLLGAWLEATLTKRRWLVQAGVRADAYLLDGGPARFTVEPRVSARFSLNDRVTLRAAAGLAHQAPTVLVSLPVSDLAGLRDGLQFSVKTEAGADVKLPLDFDASVTGFYAPVPTVIESSLEDLLENVASRGGAASTGRAWGLEVMLRHAPKGRWFGWLSYTLMRSERYQMVYDFDRFGDVTGQHQAWVPFAFDETHVLNLVGGVVLPRGWRLSGGLHLNSGRPESGIISSRAMRQGIDPGTLEPNWVPVALQTDPRLPPFVRVDVRVSKRWVFDDFTLEAFLDVLNATASSEVLGYAYQLPMPGGPTTPTKQAFSLPVVLPYLGVTGRY